MASSTTIPSASRKENRTIMFSVKLVGSTESRAGMIRKARKDDRGTARATKIALVVPMKNMRMLVTKTNPILIVLTRSWRVIRVLSDWSAVRVLFSHGGKTFFSMMATIDRKG